MQGWSEVSKEDLDNALKLLSLALKHDKTHQTMLYETLNSIQKDPRIYICFLQIMLSNNIELGLREVAGLTLKSMLKRNYEQLPKAMLGLVKTTVLQHFLKSEPRILKILSLLINMFVHEMGADIEILEFLLDGARASNEAALRCLAIVLEDLRSGSQNSQVFGSAYFCELIEKFAVTLLQLCQGPSVELAIHCFNAIICHLPSHLDHIIQQYLGVLELELRSTNSEVSYRAMEGLETISEQRKELVRESTIRLVAQSTFTDVRIRKLEFLFWIEVLDCEQNEEVCSYIPLILPKCIAALEFTAEDLANQMKIAHNTDDRYKEQREHAESHEEEEELFGDSDEKVEDGYTLRKMAGNLVGKFAVNFCEGLWELSRPTIQQLLLQPSWPHCEVAVLYIGLIAEFCKDQFSSNLLAIIGSISAIMTKLDQPQLVSTCLWTLSQFSTEIIELSRNNLTLLENYITNLLRYLESVHPNIKQAACSSIGGIVEAGKVSIAQAYPHIIGKLVEIIRTEKGETLVSLMMAVSTLAENLPEELKSEQTAQNTLKVICEKWVQMSSNPFVNQVIECLVEVVSAFQRFTKPYSSEIFQMALKVFNPSAKDLALRLSDLIITLLQTECPELNVTVQNSDIVLKAVHIIQGEDKQLKQSCYSLLSNVVKYVGISSPAQILTLVFNSCDRQSESLSNNCLFCMLQIMSRYHIGEEYVAEMYNLSIVFLDQLTPSKKIYQVNYSKIIGKLANLYPSHLAAMLPKITKRCFSGIKSEFRDVHMVDAYKGFFKLIVLNPSAAMPDFDSLVDSYLFFKAPTSETDAAFKQLLVEYRKAVGDSAWQSFLSRKLFLPATVKRINDYFL